VSSDLQPRVPKPLERLRHLIAPVSQLVVLVAVLVAVGVWGFRLNDKVETLAAQLQALAVAPAVTREVAPGMRQTEPNPLIATCSDLIKRAAKAIEDGRPGTVGEPLQQLADKFGCRSVVGGKP
jgi:hypothetical protein